MTRGCFRKCLATAPPLAVFKVRLTEAVTAHLVISWLGTAGQNVNPPTPSPMFPLLDIYTNIQSDRCQYEYLRDLQCFCVSI